MCEDKLAMCEEKLTVANDKLKATKENMKTQWQLLDSAQQALSKRDLSSLAVISSAVANAVALMNNHLAELDMEILRKDFTIDDVERETLVNSTYDAVHDFDSLYDFFSLAESDDNNSPRAL
jgi:plasmid replication initiation protein